MRKNNIAAVFLISVLITMPGCASNQLVVGERLKLWGGYDPVPRWLVGKDFLTGTVEKFIPGDNKEKAMVVRLDSPISVDGVTGNIVILQLRYSGAQWVGEGVAHVELCDFEPEEKTTNDRRRGAWVESHASFKPL